MTPWTNMEERLASAADGFPFRKLSMQETAEMGEGLCTRFRYPRAQLVRWPEIGKRAGIGAEMRKGLMRAGRAVGSDPAEWYGTFEEIPIDGLLLQQLVDFRRWETKERIANRAQQLAEIAALEVAVRTLPLAGASGSGRGADRLCVNHARHRLTAYHSLLQTYDAGDLTILNAIRARVYARRGRGLPRACPGVRAPTK